MATTAKNLEWTRMPTWFAEHRAAAGREYSPPIFWLAFARARRDGHAHFAERELAELLQTKTANVDRAIKSAVKAKWLHADSESSRRRCLVLPEGFGHTFGLAPGPCMLHNREPKRSAGESPNREISRVPDSAAESKAPQRVSHRTAKSRGSQGAPSRSIHSGNPAPSATLEVPPWDHEPSPFTTATFGDD